MEFLIFGFGDFGVYRDIHELKKSTFSKCARLLRFVIAWNGEARILKMLISGKIWIRGLAENRSGRE